ASAPEPTASGAAAPPGAALPGEARPARRQDVLRPLGRGSERHRDDESAVGPEGDDRRAPDRPGGAAAVLEDGPQREDAASRERAGESHRREREPVHDRWAGRGGFGGGRWFHAGLTRAQTRRR